MASGAAILAAQRVIDGIATAGAINGQYAWNTAMPTTSHVRPRSLWVMRAVTAGDPVCATLTEQVAWMAHADVDTAARTADAESMDIEVAVVVALGRAAAWKYFDLTHASLKLAECHVIPATDAALGIHGDHDAAVKSAFEKWAGYSARLTGIAWYNALSFEQHNHHHLPAVSGRLSKTTIVVLGLKTFFETSATAEGIIMHDMYHMLGGDVNAWLSRNQERAAALTAIGLDNLRKRIPVKASDTALAINYPELIRKARTYAHEPEDLPSELNVPSQLDALILRYRNATDEGEVRNSVEELRAMAAHMAEATVYVAGFMLGRERRAADDADLTLQLASKTNTILGSPAIKREAGNFPGAFNMGCRAGWVKASWATVAKSQADVMTRVKFSTSMALYGREVVVANRAGRPAPARPTPGRRGWFT